MNDTGEGGSTRPGSSRTLSGPVRWVHLTILTAIPTIGLLFIVGIHTALGIRVYTEQWLGAFLAACLAGTFIGVRGTNRAPVGSVPWYDYVLAILSVPAGLYITVYFPSIVLRLGFASPDRVILGAITIFLIAEAVRRLVGWTLVVVVVSFLLYAAYGEYIPGRFSAQPSSWSDLINYLYLDPNSFLWMLGLAATIGTAFITLGQVLVRFGGGEALTGLAMSLFGRFRGGGAKGAVVGSSMVGTVTGAPMSNVFLTGSVTIPMMIRSGYPRATAGGIEAVSSTGGQVLPPVMGIAAFMIAERIGLPYAEVAIAAIIPAALFYVAIFLQVDLTAGRLGLLGLSREDRPDFWSALRRAGLVLPSIGLLVYMIFVRGADPSRSAVMAAVVAFLALLVLPANRRRILGSVVGALEESGHLILYVAAVLAAAGLVVGVVSASGLGFSLGFGLVEVAGGSLAVLLVLAALGSIILGMGMPSVAAYALVAVLFAPALGEFGIEPLAAHLFIFYFAVASNITPPIAVAAFGAAPLAGASSIRTALEAMRMGAVGYVVPFVFVLSPALLMQGTGVSVISEVGRAAVGTVVIAAALSGYVGRELTVLGRSVLGAVGVLVLFPLSVSLFIGLGTGLVLAIVYAAVIGADRVKLDWQIFALFRSRHPGGSGPRRETKAGV